MKKSLQDQPQPTKYGTKLPDLSPNLHHVPPLNEDVKEDSDPQGEQDQTKSSNSNPPPPPPPPGLPPQRRQQAPPPPPPPRRDREPPPQRAEHRDRDWIAANVGKVRYDSLRILGLREGATEGEVKAAYQAMSRIYHPDKHNSGFTGSLLMRKQLNSFNI